MSPAALALIGGLALALAIALTALAFLLRAKRSLERERAERRGALERTSKLLVEKNLELFEENLRERRELAGEEDFIGIVSHQLRTPATEVAWGLDALAGELKLHPPEGRTQEYFERFEASARRMVKLVNDLVRLISVDAHLVRPITPYEPDPLVRSVAGGLSRRFTDKHISLTLVLDAGEGTLASVDSASLELVIESLIENAFDYTPAGGAITVVTATGAQGTFEFSVKDTGVGIPNAKLSSIFGKFARGEQAAHMNTGGMGLGLYLVKNVIERAKGSVSFESAEGRGSTFRFTLPRTLPHAGSLKVERGESSLARKS